jgi:hypothetical protein
MGPFWQPYMEKNTVKQIILESKSEMCKSFITLIDKNPTYIQS